MAPDSRPAVLHVTHWKAGSQWIRAVLEALVPTRIVPLKGDMSHVTSDPIVPGGVYTPVYLTREALDQAVPPGPDRRVFFVMRDLRDTMTSWYFSMRWSHVSSPFVDQLRASLEGRSDEDGLLLAILDHAQAMADIQRSWLNDDTLVLRYEDMITDERGAFRAIVQATDLDIAPERIDDAVRAHAFETLARRRKGEEDRLSHLRKGVAGDWRNHFTDRVKDAFKERFGDHLVATGYEQGTDW